MRLLLPSTDPSRMSCSTAELSSFTKQLSALVNAGIPLHEGLSLLTVNPSHDLYLSVVPELARRVADGYRFSTALAHYPRIFGRTYVGLVRAAEEVGALSTALAHLCGWLERQARLQHHVRKALAYPVTVFVITGVLTLILFRTVLPDILRTVVDLGVELPLITRLLGLIVAVVEQPVTWFAGCAVVIALSGFLRTPEGYEKLLLGLARTPLLGRIFLAASAARFCHTLGLLLEYGVDLLRASRIASDACGNPLLAGDVERLTRCLRQGESLSGVLRSSPLYPRIMVDLVAVGDESGEMAALLTRAGAIIEEDALYRVDHFMSLLEPLILVLLSIGVGFVLVAILLPLLALTSAL